MEVDIIVSFIAVAVMVTLAVIAIPQASVKCDQFLVTTTIERAPERPGIEYANYTTPAAQRAQLFAAVTQEGQRLVAAGYAWGGNSICQAFTGSVPGQSVRYGIPFNLQGVASQSGSGASVGAWLPVGALGDKRFCAAQWFDTRSSVWRATVSRHVDLPAVIDYSTEGGPWHQVCLDLEQRQQDSVKLFVAVMIVIAAVAILYVMRRV